MKKQKAEVQSRRDFFKKAVKIVLPVLGVVVWGSNPVISKAATAMGCTIDACTATCMGGCKGACSSCSHSCSGTCMSGCVGGVSNR